MNTNLKMKIFLNLTICFLAFILAFIVSFLAYSIVYYTLRFLFFIVLVISSITLTLLVLYTVLDIITYRHTYYIIDDEKIVMITKAINKEIIYFKDIEMINYRTIKGNVSNIRIFSHDNSFKLHYYDNQLLSDLLLFIRGKIENEKI